MKINTQNLWITSDTHYSHKNLTRGVSEWKITDPKTGQKVVDERATRPYRTLSEMNDTLVNHINERVGQDDWLIHLGDWSFGDPRNVTTFRERINCRNIVLLFGNHDGEILTNQSKYKSMFTHMSFYEELIHYGTRFCLFHYPITSWNGIRRGSYMIHGHQHLKGDAKFGNGRKMDVGACGNELYPYHIDEIVDLLKDRVFVPDENDHHS